MDDGDRLEKDGDPAERSEAADGDGRDDQEETHTADASEPIDLTEPTTPADASDSTDVSTSTDVSDSTDASDSIDTPVPTESNGSVEPADTTGATGNTEPDEYSSGSGNSTSEDRWDRGVDRHRDDTVREDTRGFAHRFRHDTDGVLMWIREMLSSVAIVLMIGLILFGISGVWPPMVAVESGSMEPNMDVGDLVFVTEPGRLAPDAAHNEVGVVTSEVGQDVGYRTFGSYGSVVIYRPPGRTGSPIIHRAMFHVEEGENWYDRADDQYHGAAGCTELNYCPAPHDGFITRGDNNRAYDQSNGLAPPVKAEWVTGVARVRVPYLGYVRLLASGQAKLSDVIATSIAIAPGTFVGPGTVDERGVVAGPGTLVGTGAVAGRETLAAPDLFGGPSASSGDSIASAPV